jgi:hypothetical protein
MKNAGRDTHEVADLLGFDGWRGILLEHADASGPSVMDVITHRWSSELSSELTPESFAANETTTEGAIAREVR